MKNRVWAFAIPAVILLAAFLVPSLLTSQRAVMDKPSKEDVAHKMQRIQIPFVANNGQVDAQVKFYANTFGGTVFVTKEGEIVYALPNNSSDVETQCLASSMHSPSGISPLERGDKGVCNTTPISNVMNGTHPRPLLLEGRSGVALNEQFVGAKTRTIQGEEKSVTKVNYFKGNDSSKWKSNISTYDVVNLGKIYKGIELKLKAYGNNVEKLFCVKPDANPDQIQVNLSGAKGLRVNDEGQLVAETELGAVKFTKPIAYQEVDGKRVEVDVKYMLSNLKSEVQNRKSEYGFTVAAYDKTCDLIIDPLLASTFLGGSGYDYRYYSLALDTSGNMYVTGSTSSADFPTTSGVYDTSFNGGAYDVFVSKLDSGLTSLLASTYLGGSNDDDGRSIALDTSGNVYVIGYTTSTDFPTTSGAYDTSQNDSGYNDVFISKLNSGLTTLLASTYLGGDSGEGAYSLTLDTSGNVYVTGSTSSTDFPTTSGAYDTSYDGGDVFISKLNSGLTSLLASTYLGGSGEDYGYSLALDTSGNVYVTGLTTSANFPTTNGAYDTSYNGGDYNVFVSKLDGGLTSLLASTYLGGSGTDYGRSLALDTTGNVYVTGNTGSTNFPTTSGAYDTSYNGGNYDVFVSKLDGGLTSLLASTYLGGSYDDQGWSLALDTSGNVYVTGRAWSSFPTTSGAYDTSGGSSGNVFVSKLNGGLTSLLASTFLGGSDGDYGQSLTLDTSGNVYVTGYTYSSDFPTTSGAYDTSYNGGDYDVFVSKLDGNLSSPKPTATTDSATNVTLNSATLNGTVNANNWSNTVWFDYGKTSGSYENKSSTETVTGSSETTVSITISRLSPSTTYYYRIAAESDAGTFYGDELSFTTLSDTTAPTGFISIDDDWADPEYATSTEVTLILSAKDTVGVTGYYISENSTTPFASDPGWTPITSVTSYNASVSYTLSNGDGNKTIYVWYKDDSGNVSTTASDSITLDTTPPIVTIASPTSNDTYTTTNSKINIGGSATDSTSGINEITWSNNYGINGTANGTTGWSILEISLLIGENTITVTATDNAGNTGTDVITVNLTEGGQGSISGYVVGIEGNPVENAKVSLKGKKVFKKTVSDEDGLFEFLDLDAGKYVIKAIKKGYKRYNHTIRLKEGEETEIEIEMKKISKRQIKKLK